MQIFMVAHTVAAGVALLSFGSLCTFHFYLQILGMGTYDWILSKRSTTPTNPAPSNRAASPVVEVGAVNQGTDSSKDSSPVKSAAGASTAGKSTPEEVDAKAHNFEVAQKPADNSVAITVEEDHQTAQV